MKMHYHNDDFLVGLIGSSYITALALMPIFLAIALLRFAFSSKQAAIFTLCFGGMLLLMFNAPSWKVEFELPFEKMLQDTGLLEESKSSN